MQRLNWTEKESYEKKLAKQAEEQERTNAQYESMLEERRKLKGLWAAQKTEMKIIGKKTRGTKKKKKDFRKRISGSENSIITRVADKRTSSTNTGMLNMQNKKKSFKAHRTKEGKVYYSDIDTGSTVWSVPNDAIVL